MASNENTEREREGGVNQGTTDGGGRLTDHRQHEDKGVVDKMARFYMKLQSQTDPDLELLPEDKAKGELLLPLGVTQESMKDYLVQMVKRAQKPFERHSDRQGKMFESPLNFAPIADHQILLDGRKREKVDDAGLAIFEEILRHGRQTIDELIAHLGGYDPKFLTIMVNAMIAEDYLKFYIETGADNPQERGLRTLELVEVKERKRLADARYHKRKELLDPQVRERRLLLEALPSVDALKPIVKEEEPLLFNDYDVRGDGSGNGSDSRPDGKQDANGKRELEGTKRDKGPGDPFDRLGQTVVPNDDLRSVRNNEYQRETVEIVDEIQESKGVLSDKVIARIKNRLKITNTN